MAALAAGGRAEAHAQLVAAEPAAGSIVAAPPAAVSLTFSEPVRPLVLRWFRTGAAPVDGAASVEGARIAVAVPAGTGDGTLLLSWRVVSEDGHPISGSHAFSVGAATAVDAAPDARPALAAAVARGVLTVLLVLGVGGAVFACWIDRGPPSPAARALAGAAAIATVPAAVLAFGLHGADLLGLPPGALRGAAVWGAAAASPFAATAVASIFAGLAAAGAVYGRGGAGRALALALLAWAAAALSLALFGHAATAPPRWLAAPAVAVHAAAFIFWIGALPGLAARAASGGPTLILTLRRFSAVAVPLVTLLVASGAALAVIQLRHPAALIATPYGRLLAAKLVLAAALLALAAGNRLWLTPAVAAERAGAARRLRRSVLAEIALGLAILALASGFRLTPPPRAMVEAAALEARTHLHGATVMASLTLNPGKPGANVVDIRLGPASVQPLEVEIAFADPAEGVEPIRLRATGAGAVWRAGPLPLPHGGDWQVSVSVLIDAFSKETLSGTISAGRR